MGGFRLGRVFGVDVRIDASWIVIFGLVTWSLTAQLAKWHADWPMIESLAIAAGASLLFFGCVLVHELAHSVVAKSYGLCVRSVTLFLFGGIANVEREPRSAKAEFFTALVGPLASIVIGVAATAFASLATATPTSDIAQMREAMSRLGPLATLLAWLGPVNLVIAGFNLIPGFPLDGGRILRSVVWAATGNLRLATRIASAAGQIIGWALIATGVAMAFGLHVPLFGSGLGAGIWLAFIGWFLRSAAAGATSRLAVDEALRGMTVGQLMHRQCSPVSPDLTIAELVQEHLLANDHGAVPVVRGRELLGVVASADVRRVTPDRWGSTAVASVMCAVGALAVATPGEPLASAFERLAQRDVGQLPVVERGELVGMLRRRDVTRRLELTWKPNARGPLDAANDATRAPNRSQNG
jgi:Zn-dependent protease/predicted transcriptional regulator